MDREIRRFIIEEVRRECQGVPKRKKSVDGYDMLLLFSVVMFFGTWLIAATSVVFGSEFPTELVMYTTLFSGVIGVSCMCKSCYESKLKAERGWEGGNV